MEPLTIHQWIAFSILSIIIIFFSKHVLFKPKSHGFYRFFGWEGIAWLLVNNYKYWFENAFSIYQIVSWILLIYATVLVVAGGFLFKMKGKADNTRKDDALFGFERTTELIETGLYKYIRHPLYGSLIFLIWGILFKQITVELLIVSIASTAFMFVTSLIEEKENIKYFGEKYKDYIKRSKMYVPYIF